MNRTTYLVPVVDDFAQWLAGLMTGQPLGFAVGGAVYSVLADAYAAYAWPPKRKSGLPNPHGNRPYVHPIVPALPAHATFSANAAVLQALESALQGAFGANPPAPVELAGAVAAILHWGGVYTTLRNNGGNAGWLAANFATLHATLQAVVHDHALGDDQSAVTGLRFNSGMTKVYALLINDFVIYDSRVAAALAWLAMHWTTCVRGRPAAAVHAHLRFGRPPANRGGRSSNPNAPRKDVFLPLNNDPMGHYTWNIRANWVLSQAHAHAKANGGAGPFTTLRDTEAALFQLGGVLV